MNQMVHSSSAKEKLLERAIGYIQENGLGDLSLRQLAAAIGTSHRMVIYHYGSFEELLVEIVDRQEADELAYFETLLKEPELDRTTLMRKMWRRLATPASSPRERLFFELYGQALQGRPGTERFLERVVSRWLDRSVELVAGSGVPRKVARAQARLDLAVTRGLLLDLLTTGDRAGTTAALERYLEATSPRTS
jgi:AcrR family transcriptional regulator